MFDNFLYCCTIVGLVILAIESPLSSTILIFVRELILLLVAFFWFVWYVVLDIFCSIFAKIKLLVLNKQSN